MDPVDWQTGKTPLECTKYMLDYEVNCDVNFKVGEYEEVIKAHKLILSMRSAVFDRMFNGSFCESEEDPLIPDVTPAAFKTLLRYCYYECLDIESDIALSVLYASTKYMLPLLVKAARRKLLQSLSGSNVWDVYTYAINVRDTKLLEGCHMFFQGNITSVQEALQAEAFLNIPHKVLLEFLHINDEVDNVASLNHNPRHFSESNTASMRTSRFRESESMEVDYKNHIGISISEIELFKRCIEWAEAECLRQKIDPTGANKRTVLHEALFLIRFPTMLPKDLADYVYPTGILTQTEIVNLCLSTHATPGTECQVDFPSREREFVVTATEPSEKLADTSTLFIESEVRVMLTRIWIRGSGRFKVTVSNLTSNASFSMEYDTKFKGHITEVFGKSFAYAVLFYIEIKPQLLEAGTKYAITAEWLNRSDLPDQNLVTKWVVIGDLSPLKEVKTTCDASKDNSIHALTLCLV